MDTNRTALKNNNSGFTLLEVMVGVIILAIMSVPIYRAFATSAQTNARAKIEAKCTTAAENVMEDFRSLSTKDLLAKVEKYEDPAFADATFLDKCQNCGAEGLTSAKCPTCGTINLMITGNDEMRSELPDGYYTTVVLDPSKYEHANDLNISDFGSVSPLEAAIYTCKADLDEEAVQEFVNRNVEYCKTKSGAIEYYQEIEAEGVITYEEKPEKKITDNMGKSVTITLKEISKEDKANGDKLSLCKVDIKIDYDVEKIKGNAFNTDDVHYIAEQAYLFNNVTSKRDLTGVYYFFKPRDTHGKELIQVLNLDNIESNLYVVAIGTNEVNAVKNVDVEIVEDFSAAPEKANLTLRTNMLKTNYNTGLRTPYDKNDAKNNSDSYEALADVVYTNSTKTTVADSCKVLQLADIDGKRVYAQDDDEARIYRLKVVVYDPDGNIVMKLSGSKLNGVY